MYMCTYIYVYVYIYIHSFWYVAPARSHRSKSAIAPDHIVKPPSRRAAKACMPHEGWAVLWMLIFKSGDGISMDYPAWFTSLQFANWKMAHRNRSLTY